MTTISKEPITISPNELKELSDTIACPIYAKKLVEAMLEIQPKLDECSKSDAIMTQIYSILKIVCSMCATLPNVDEKITNIFNQLLKEEREKFNKINGDNNYETMTLPN